MRIGYQRGSSRLAPVRGRVLPGARPALAQATATGNVVIISGGYGVARAQEPIGWYDKLLRLADWPPGLLEAALIRRPGGLAPDTVVAFVAQTPYAQLLRRTPWQSGCAHAWSPSRASLTAPWLRSHAGSAWPSPRSGTSSAIATRLATVEPVMTDARQAHLDQFYRLLTDLAGTSMARAGFTACTGRDDWPRQGVYFFFEDGETRVENGTSRVVRVGTHGLSPTDRTTLWGRLRQHRGRISGRNPGGGNHRASIFRGHIGTALIQRDHGRRAAGIMGQQPAPPARRGMRTGSNGPSASTSARCHSCGSPSPPGPTASATAHSSSATPSP